MRFHASPTITLDAALRDLQSDKPQVRVRAAEGLAVVAESERETAATALLAALNDSDEQLRYQAALSLGELRWTAATGALAELLAGPAALPRQGAAAALGQIGGLAARAALLAAVSDADADVRFQLPAALTLAGGLDIPEVQQLVLDALQTLLGDHDAEVRASAAAALGDIAAPASCEVLAAKLDDDAESVRLEAALSLARLGDERGTRVLLAHLDDRDQALAVAERLFAQPPSEAKAQLAERAERLFGDPAVRVYLAGALAKLGDPRGREGLHKALFGRNTIATGLAIELCGQLAAPWAHQELEALRADRRGRDWQEELTDALALSSPTGC